MEEVVVAPEGRVLEASVKELSENHVVVNLPGVGEGLVPRRELMPRGSDTVTVGVGDAISVYVEHQAEPGRYLVSKDMADRLALLERIERAYESNQTLQGDVVGEMPGGYAVDIGIKAFLPASQVALRAPKDPEEVLGQTLDFKIIRYDRARTNVVLSRRALLEAERDKTLDRLRIGSIVEGTVVRLADFGAFVDLGPVEGLLHISDISWGKITHPSEAVKVGQALTLKVLRFDKKAQKLSLGLRQIEDDPWVQAKTKYPPGTKVRGMVVSKTDFGCFIEIEQGLEGLVHATGPLVSDSAKERLRKTDIGDELSAVVLDLDLTSRRLSLAVEETQN